MSATLDRPLRSERKARGSGHLRRAELLAAAERIFTVEGYDGATIRKIAEEVGVSSTALYMYFQDKSQMMLEICVRSLEELLQTYDAVSQQSIAPEARLRGILEAFLAFGGRQPTAYQLLYGNTPRELNARRHAVIAPLSRSCFQRVQKAVEDAIAGGALRAGLSPRATTEALIGACHGIVTMRQSNPYAPWTETEVLAKTLLDGLFDGFKAR